MNRNSLHTHHHTAGKTAAWLTLVLLVFGCTRHDEAEHQPLPMATQHMAVTLSIPAENTLLRSAGDPGTDTARPLPKYVYLWLWASNGSAELVTTMQLTGLTAESWVLQGSGTTREYRYRNPIYIEMAKDATQARLYGLAAQHDRNTLGVAADPATRASLEEMTFGVPTLEGNHAYLADVYSSPAANTNEDTNGTVHDVGTLEPTVSLVLYHTAAKVDFTWNINPSDNDGRTLDDITITECIGGKAYLFKDTPRSMTGVTPYTTQVIGGTAVNPGNQWMGRADTYTIQPADRQVRWTMTFSNSTSTSQISTPNDLTAVYPGWYRINATVGY